jgi:hypothetical protein
LLLDSRDEFCELRIRGMADLLRFGHESIKIHDSPSYFWRHLQARSHCRRSDTADTTADTDDLTRADDGRNASHSSVAISRHIPRSFQTCVDLLRARRSQSTSMKHPITGTVEEGRSRHETA